MWVGAKQPPYNGPAPRQLPVCYDETWKPELYRHKTPEELAFWAKCLKTKMTGYLEIDPFPADLFEKLEKRLNAIKAEIDRRRKESGKPTTAAALKRAREMVATWEKEETLSTEDGESTASTENIPETAETGTTTSATSSTSQTIEELRKERARLALLRSQANDERQRKRLKIDQLQPSFSFNEDTQQEDLNIGL